MKRLAPVIFLAFLVSTSLACMAAERIIFGVTPTPIPTPTKIPTITPTPDTCPNGNCITGCIGQLGAIVDDETNTPGKSNSPRRVFSWGEEYTLVTYDVSGEEIDSAILDTSVPKNMETYQENKTAHKAIWNYFAAIIPADQRSFLNHFIIFTDGKENILAWVGLSDEEPEQWDLSVDILDSSDPKDLTFTLIHEFGHLLTLNADQVTPSLAVLENPNDPIIFRQEAKACPNYFPGEGCSASKSYINLFVNRFWDEIYDEWAAIDYETDDEVYDRLLEEFYQKYEDQFVTDYAPSNPEEDIAETWSYFVLLPKPAADTIADEKVLFFYEFPELVKLREQIARNLCAQLEK